MTDLSDSVVFEKARPRLLGLAYRMLGSMADAEDAVQDTFLRWRNIDKSTVVNGSALLTSICTNRCLDDLKAARRKRLDYVGPWIPEPLQVEAASDPEADLDRAQSLTTAFLLLLDRLSPKERAAYLLRDVFGQSYAEVAAALGLSESACRQLVSRASKHLKGTATSHMPSPDHQQRMLSAFLAALESGSVEVLSGLLAETVQFQSDGGGKAKALQRILEGRDMVAKYLARILGRLLSGARLEPLGINGLHGIVVFQDAGLETALTLGYAPDGTIARVFIIRNPDKLHRLAIPLRHDLKSGGLQQ